MKKLFWVSLLVFILSSCVSNEDGVDLAVEYYNVGNAFFEADQLNKASEYYNKVLDIDPDYHKARYNLINLQIKNLNFESANNNISYLKKVDAMNLRIRKLEAYIRYSEGNIEEALDIYLKVYQDGDVSEELRLNIVKLYYQLGFYEKALTFISELLIGEESKSLYYIAGLVAEGSKDYLLAAEYYQSYISLKGDDVKVLKSLSNIYKEQKDYQNQKAVLELMTKSSDEVLKAESLYQLAWITFLIDNDFSQGYDYLVDAITAGFSSDTKAEELLKEPDLIEIDKIRQLFIDNNIIE